MTWQMSLLNFLEILLLSYLQLSRTREWTSRGLGSVIVRLGSPVCASLSMEALAVEYNWNRYDLDVILRLRLDWIERAAM